MLANLLSVTVISPHQDDAALSLGAYLSGLSHLPSIAVRLVNCFTVSNYSPFKCLGACRTYHS